MKESLLTLLTRALNTYLLLDPDSKMRLAALDGKVFALTILPLQMTFYGVFTVQGITLQSEMGDAPDVHIKGTPLQLLGVMLQKENRQKFFAEDVVIDGNAELGQQVIHLFDALDIDWEDFFAQMIGDVPAYQAGRFLRGIRNQFNAFKDYFSHDVNEYVHEEAEIAPEKNQLEDFFNAVDTLRMDVDRLTARLEQLRKLAQHEVKA